MSKGFPNNFLWGAATSAYQVEGAAYEAVSYTHLTHKIVRNVKNFCPKEEISTVMPG